MSLQLIERWQQLSSKPGGKWLFSKALGRFVPYSGSVGAMVEELRPGYARLVLNERRAIRNHLRSIHAVALVNVGELASGLAMLAGLGANARGIVVKLTCEYFKKSRGRLIVECQCDPPSGEVDEEIEVVAHLRDAEGDEVARVTAHWKVGPVPKKQRA